MRVGRGQEVDDRKETEPKIVDERKTEGGDFNEWVRVGFRQLCVQTRLRILKAVGRVI